MNGLLALAMLFAWGKCPHLCYQGSHTCIKRRCQSCGFLKISLPTITSPKHITTPPDNSSPVLGMSFLSSTAGSSLAGGSLWQLQEVVTKLTGKNAILYYSFYGCYCGVGGQGQPKDATDRCCQLHDACYDSLQKYHCNAKLRCYQYSWHSNRLTCKGDSWCAQMSCECDRSLGLCLRRSAKSYNRRYLLYLKSKCR